MALPPGFLEELRARTPLSALVGRRVRLARAGRHSKGCCPFHDEKTPSFYVYDDHFHCFSCGAHGDAISFVMRNQGSTFIEAVEQLASEAGLEMPKPTPEAAAADRLRRDLHAVLQEAARIFQTRLRAPEGRPALSYLRDRGLSDDTIDRFGLGWSGDRRGVLASEMASAGISQASLAEVGLMRPADVDRQSGEMFFSRVMFPIRDGRGRVISFGGRTLGSSQPKYVNGPETELFSKRRTLFALDLARSAVQRGAEVLVVEGYMDVIALHQAGFQGAVAPLGTALTIEQLEELWRLSPSPFLCFDGDAAGGRAAVRAVETALSLVAPDRSLRIVTLDPNEDPDTLIRRGGPDAFKRYLASAAPLVDALFGQCREAGGDGTPEQRAAFRRRLMAAAAQIGDRTLAAEYRRELLDRFFELRTAGALRNGASRAKPFKPLRKPPIREAPGAKVAAEHRARVLVAILLRHPDLLRDTEEAFTHLDLPPALARIRQMMLQWWFTATTLDTEALVTHLTGSGLSIEVEQTVSSIPVPLPRCAQSDAMPAEAEAGWWHFFGLMDPGRLDREVEAARRELANCMDGPAQRRLIALCAARNALNQGEHGAEPDRAADML